MNKSERSYISKIRLSSHNLAIEKGRHLSIPIDQRKCNVCNSGAIESEEHFIFKCTKYADIRKSFETSINNHFLSKEYNSNKSCFLKSCFYSKSLKVLKLTSSFFSQCFALRNQM